MRLRFQAMSLILPAALLVLYCFRPAASCSLNVAGRHTVYISRGRETTVSITCDVVDCTGGGSILWEYPPQLQENVEIDHDPFSSALRVTSLGLEESGDFEYQFICTYAAAGITYSNTHSLQIIALPYAIDDGADIKYLKAGEESHVECPLYPGNPPGQIHWTKDGKDITELGDRLTTRDGGRKLLFCRAALNLSGEYNCFVDSDYPTYDDQSDRSQIVRIVVQSELMDETTFLTTTVGETELIHCHGPRNETVDRSWRVEKDGVTHPINSSNQHYSISGDETKLQINSIAADDLGGRITCELENGVSRATQTTVLLYNEYLSLCTEKEENTEQLEHVLQATLSYEACKDDKDCMVRVTDLVFTPLEEGVYEVRGMVASSGQAVKIFDSTLLERGVDGYITHGMTIRSDNCKGYDPTPFERSSTETAGPDRRILVGGGVVIMLLVVVMVIVVSCICLRGRGAQRVGADIEAQQQRNAQQQVIDQQPVAWQPEIARQQELAQQRHNPPPYSPLASVHMSPSHASPSQMAQVPPAHTDISVSQVPVSLMTRSLSSTYPPSRHSSSQYVTHAGGLTRS